MTYISFAFFCVCILGAIIYFLIPYQLKMYWLLLMSVLFYASIDWHMLIYLIIIIFITYCYGIVSHTFKNSKTSLFIVIVLCLIPLLFVKWGNYVSIVSVSIVVPIGISFYTLQAISYCVDVYRGNYQYEKNVCRYALYLSYFPTVVQGPIGRYDKFIQQLNYTENKGYDYDRIKQGVQLILWGIFKKLVIANRLTLLVAWIYNNYTIYYTLTILMGILAFSIQIYADFSGCVDICRGVSNIFGIKLMKNFNSPYYAQSIKDFWHRWHISLSTWLKDYIYIPLGGNRKGSLRKYMNIVVTFLISGLWHGVGIHYIAWGALHGIYQVIGNVAEPFRQKCRSKLGIEEESYLIKFCKIVCTFVLVSFTWLFFRCDTISQVFGILHQMFRVSSGLGIKTCYLVLKNTLITNVNIGLLLIALVLYFAIEYGMAKGINMSEKINKCHFIIRWGIYYFLMICIILSLNLSGQDFLYSKF